jgi:hypothetical protein
MASVHNRGTRTSPRFHVRIKIGGKWVSRRCHAQRLTQRTYVHFVRRTLSAALFAPMQLGAKVIPLRAAAAPAADERQVRHG